MSDIENQPGHFSVERYFEMAECGILSPDDRTELLDGLIVAMSPPSPLHDSAVHKVQYALLRKLGLDVAIRVQSTFLAADTSVLVPDVAIVPGSGDDYSHRHPSRAHLIVEISQSSLMQDRLTKSAIYARAGVPCYWIVNLREECVEVFRNPDRWKSSYESVTRATGDDCLEIDAFPGVVFEARNFFPTTLNLE